MSQTVTTCEECQHTGWRAIEGVGLYPCDCALGRQHAHELYVRRFSRWQRFELLCSALWSAFVFRFFVHDKKTCRAAVCTICGRNAL